MDVSEHLRVNPLLCDAAGHCAEIVPERVHLDEWGYPVVDESPIHDRGCRRNARRAVASCPRLALMLVSDDDRDGWRPAAPPSTVR